MYTKYVSRSEKYQRFYEIIREIPPGKVATYGQIATLAGYHGQARQVGYALHASPEDMEIPWQRVINAKGEISLRSDSFGNEIQRQMLIAEGVRFDSNGRIPLKEFQWNPKND